MRKKLHIFITLYFLSVCFTFGNPMEGNRLDECGPAIYTVKNNKLISSVNVTLTTGGFFYSLASTSGTSECEGFVINDEQRVHFIVTNFYEIQEDVSKGEGVYLDGLTTIMGCEGINFKIILKNNYESIFNENNSDGKQIYNVLRYKINNSELKNHCIDYS